MCEQTIVFAVRNPMKLYCVRSGTFHAYERYLSVCAHITIAIICAVHASHERLGTYPAYVRTYLHTTERTKLSTLTAIRCNSELWPRWTLKEILLTF
ncbi:hypothetical protein HOLleu_35556 [Holothuria leucospilota]|uniref:Uncharacterized protein n=1 Tax=Holothuria leucospilota TaxID=206669 RepID=A0A9Q0YKZ2_HOLLE|nr:hypothetical protein HOLleu_35556 [Holothuria leucospilota]